MPQLPKLSYVLLSHNREKYIRTAIESAFAQDYEGELEYIFSDDCSTDRTFEIIKECVAAYKGGRRVVVTQTPTNLRSAGNFNHALSFAKGDWIIRADDDDISSVSRCSITAKAVSAVPDCTFVAISSQYQFTDKTEEDILALSRERHEEDLQYTVTDIKTSSIQDLKFTSWKFCYLTWNAALYREFGDLPQEGALSDDLLYFLRAAFTGKGILLSAPPLYFIRRGSLNQSRGKDNNHCGYADIVRREKFMREYYTITQAALVKTREELMPYVRKRYSDAELEAARGFIQYLEDMLEENRLFKDYWEKSPLYRFRLNKRWNMNGVYGMLRCLPLPAYAAIHAAFLKLFRK